MGKLLRLDSRTATGRRDTGSRPDLVLFKAPNGMPGIRCRRCRTEQLVALARLDIVLEAVKWFREHHHCPGRALCSVPTATMRSDA